MTPKEYRRHIVEFSVLDEQPLTETMLCNKDYELLTEHFPKLTAGNYKKYNKCFRKYVPGALAAYIESGKMKVTGLTVVDLLKKILSSRKGASHCANIVHSSDDIDYVDAAMDKLENELVDKMLKDEEVYNILATICVIDRSGSMFGGPDIAAVALGMFITRVLA